MTGNDRRIVIQARDERLLRELTVMRVADRELVKLVGGFRSTTRANARLLALVNAGLLRRFFQGTTAGGKKALYTLSSKGAQLIGSPCNGLRHRSDEMVTANFFVAHQMAVNEIYCAAKYGTNPAQGVRFVRWLGFSAPITPAISLIPDGYFELRTEQGALAAFLEIDLGNEGATVWKKKVQNYLRYATSGEFEKRFGQTRFRVLVITNSESRLQAIRKTVREVTEKIFWFTTLDAIRREGLWNPVWLRPSNETLRSSF